MACYLFILLSWFWFSLLLFTSKYVIQVMMFTIILGNWVCPCLPYGHTRTWLIFLLWWVLDYQSLVVKCLSNCKQNYYLLSSFWWLYIVFPKYFIGPEKELCCPWIIWCKCWKSHCSLEVNRWCFSHSQIQTRLFWTILGTW